MKVFVEEAIEECLLKDLIEDLIEDFPKSDKEVTILFLPKRCHWALFIFRPKNPLKYNDKHLCINFPTCNNLSTTCMIEIILF